MNYQNLFDYLSKEHCLNLLESELEQIRLISEVMTTRQHQHEIWGEQNHKPSEWQSILIEEVGEQAKAINDADWDNYRVELLQVAALCLQMIECFDRNKKL